MFMMRPLLRLSDDVSLHEYWCDGVDLVYHRVIANSFAFAGACILSDAVANSMWIVPFEFQIDFADNDEWPACVSLNLGHHDTNSLFDRTLKCGPEHRLYALSHCVYGNRPSELSDWAIRVDLNPYPSSNTN